MSIITYVAVQYSVDMNQDGVDNLEAVCAAAKTRAVLLMETAFASLGLEVDTVSE